METVKKLIALEKQLQERKENDPQSSQNALYYATKERDIYKHLNDQFSQLVDQKMTETQNKQVELMKIQKTSQQMISDAQSQWAAQNNSRIMYNEKDYIKKLKEQKAEKADTLDAIIKEEHSLLGLQQENIIDLHTKGFSEMEIKFDEIYASMPRL